MRNTQSPALRIMIVPLGVIALALAGCQPVEITPQQMANLGATTEKIAEQMDGYQETADNIAAALEGAGLVDEETTAKLDKINKEIDRLEPQILEVAKAVKEAEYTGGEAVITALEAARAGNRASAPFNKYAPVIDLGLLGATILAGFFGKKKATEARIAKAKYKSHKRGVETTLRDPEIAGTEAGKALDAKLYSNIGAARKDNGIS